MTGSNRRRQSAVVRRRAGRALVVAALLALSTTVLACGGAAPTGSGTAGSGTVRSEQRPVSGFSKVQFGGVGTLMLTQSGSESLTIEADDNILPLLISEVREGTLFLDIKPGANIGQAARINYTLTAKQLDGFLVTGAGQARLVDLATPSLRVGIVGVGEVSAAGRADDQQVDLPGTGKYDAGSLASKSATVKLTGAGTVVVQVSDSLNAEVTGAGTVEYIGNPTVTKQVTGLGTVEKRG